MKKYLSIIVLLFALMSLASCGTELPESFNNVEVNKGDKSLKVSVQSLSFIAAGGSDSFTITSNTACTIACDQLWCSVSPSSGSGYATITVYVQKNTSTDSRSATITVKAGDLLQSIIVTQEGAPSARTFTVNGVSFKMICVDGGTFTMGATSEQGSDAESDETPTHSVTLSTYYIGETEVTQELWQAVMGSNPSWFSGSQKPVERVSWYDCQDFVKMLNLLTGQNFRLPTEAEWEFAARGGNSSRGYVHAGSNTIDDVAWYRVNSDDVSSSSSDYGTHTVATKSPNELGMYDMSGNVEEWCQDWYGNYSSSSQTNPTGPSSGSYRVHRGGGWGSYARSCRVSSRSYYSSSVRSSYLGLRLAL